MRIVVVSFSITLIWVLRALYLIYKDEVKYKTEIKIIFILATIKTIFELWFYS